MFLKTEQGEASRENLYWELFGQVVMLLQFHFLITKLTELVLLFILYYTFHKSLELLWDTFRAWYAMSSILKNMSFLVSIYSHKQYSLYTIYPPLLLYSRIEEMWWTLFVIEDLGNSYLNVSSCFKTRERQNNWSWYSC